MITEITRRLNCPTPPFFKRLGKAINGLGTTLQVAFAGLQAGDVTAISHRTYIYAVIGIAITQWFGSTVTDLATEDKQQEDATGNR